jgi:putative DNA methylase
LKTKDEKVGGVSHKKKLIEVSLPLDVINDASAYDKMPGIGPHPKGVHHWWARLPLPAARAMLFASLITDPSDDPRFKDKSEAEQDAERDRLFGILRQMLRKKIHEHPEALARAYAEIERHCDGKLPTVLDPFCGGGSIPLEAQRLGLPARGSDLNPVAVLITKAVVEIVPRFANAVPVHPEARRTLAHSGNWSRGKGLAEDVRRYGADILQAARERIGHLYPKGPNGETILTWLWARTVKCPNPACGAVMPLVRSFSLSTKAGRQTWVEPVVNGNQYTFEIKTGKGKPRAGTINRRGATCICCNTPVAFDYVRTEGKAGRLGVTLLAMVANAGRGKAYLPPEASHTAIVMSASTSWRPETQLPEKALGFRVQGYGMTRHGDLFTSRQLAAMETLSDLVKDVRTRILVDAQTAGMANDGQTLAEGGTGATAYADAAATFLTFAIDRLADFNCALSTWKSSGEQQMHLFTRQAIPMVWDFTEANILGDRAICWKNAVELTTDAVETAVLHFDAQGKVEQLDAARAIRQENNLLVSTDPPYYDNIGYADLSDFFYVWLRRTLGGVYPQLFSTLLVPKAAELVADPSRFDGDKDKAKEHFEGGFKQTFTLLKEKLDPRFPMTVYYAFKQDDEGEPDEEDGSSGVSLTTGWETLLESLITTGFQITATWPVRASQQWRMRSMGSNALASYIILACRPRSGSASMTTRRDFLAQLKTELPTAIRHLQHASVQAVDLAQAAIGPGMAVYSRYSRVVEASGERMGVRTALALINQILDEVLTEQESEYDADTRWALAWFEQYGHDEGDFGDANTLATAKATAVSSLVQGGILFARAGRVRLLRREELAVDWDPTADERMPVWELTQQLIRALVERGEVGAAEILRKVGALGDVAHDLAYRLFALCERKGWAQEAIAYNSLSASWPEIERLAREASGSVESSPRQGDLL